MLLKNKKARMMLNQMIEDQIVTKRIKDLMEQGEKERVKTLLANIKKLNGGILPKKFYKVWNEVQ